ncbi:Sister chromatid cohesion protein SCC4 [Glycine max]|nr:Sister chromatid cohesion protein SCC4 [Glycine max]
MEAVAEGLWGLAEYHEKRGEIGKAVKCLEAICQSDASFFPIVEVKTRLRIATLLLHHSHNVNHAKSHLERSQLLLKSIPSCFELKCRAYSLLSQCYHLVGAIPPQKQVLHKGLELAASVGYEISMKLWSCNFNSQLANALSIEGDYQGSISALECGYVCATEVCFPELQLLKLGITDGVREVDLQHSSIWMAGVYLMLLIQFLENKVAIELTRAEFVEAQEALVQMKNWFMRFPTILQACECIFEMLRGQYAHSVGCYHEAAFHFIEAVKTANQCKQCAKFMQLSLTSALALDLIGPVYGVMDSFVGVREKTGVLFAYGLLLMKQQDLQEARNRLARGLQLTHTYLGNLQFVSQYLTILGSLALALHDTVQAREILRSSLTLAKKLYDIPTQIWVLSVLTALYKELGERGNEMENAEYQNKKLEDLQRRLANAHASIYHIEIIDKVRLEVHQLNDLDIKRAMADPTMGVNLDIPESIGLSAPLSAPSSSRLVDIDTRRRGKRRI